MTARRVLIPVLLAVAVVAAWWWFPTADRQIRAACRELAEALSSPPAESDVERLARLARISRFLTADVSIETATGAPRLEGRDAILAALSGVVRTGALAVMPGRMTVVVSDSSEQASVRVSLTIVRNNDPETSEVLVAELTWRHSQEGWQLSHAIERAPDDLAP